MEIAAPPNWFSASTVTSSATPTDDRYATFFYGVYDGDTKTFTYTNAGHLAPFFVHDGKVEELSEGGTRRRLVRGISVHAAHDSRGCQEACWCYSAMASPNLKMCTARSLATTRLVKKCFAIATCRPQRLAENLIAAAELWAGSPEQADDMTVVVARMG